MADHENGVVDATATEIEEAEPHHAVGHEIVRAAPAGVTPVVKATELVERLDVIRDAMTTAMTPDVDYGVIPGTNKPTLLKPGAEKLSVLFQLDVQLVNEKRWGPDDHLTVTSHATAFHAPSGARLGYGEGLCSTREKKYAYRKQERTCPQCSKAAVIAGKAEYGGGWLCWKKRDGCGAKFSAGDQTIEGQAVGEIDNPDLPDLWNTALKIAEKRARVDVVLAVTGASALFTQDVEDDAQPAAEAEPSQPSQAASQPAAAAEQVTPELYRSIVESFQASTCAPAALASWLDKHQVPAGDGLHERVSVLDARTGRALKAWLDDQREAVPA
jgi:hypothetical protein